MLTPPGGTGIPQYCVDLYTKRPAEARITRRFSVEVPKDCGADDDLIIHDLESGEIYEARADLLIPEPRGIIPVLISIWVQGVLNKTLKQLSEAAAESLKSKGY